MLATPEWRQWPCQLQTFLHLGHALSHCADVDQILHLVLHNISCIHLADVDGAAGAFALKSMSQSACWRVSAPNSTCPHTHLGMLPHDIGLQKLHQLRHAHIDIRSQQLLPVPATSPAGSSPSRGCSRDGSLADTLTLLCLFGIRH